MVKTKVLLLGATGQTGESILGGLIRDGDFDISILVRDSSAQKPESLALASRGFPVISVDLLRMINPSVLAPFDIVISAIGPGSQSSQLNLATAAKAAGIQRFVPCGFITVCPPGGVMHLRDTKEEVYNHILQLHLPYTIIDTGFWHQLSFPRLKSGRVDKAIIYSENKIYGNGNAPNLLTDLRDIGNFVARVIKDPRTLNKKVFTWSDELSQNQIYTLVESITGESVSRTHVANDKLAGTLSKTREAVRIDPENTAKLITLYAEEYNNSKYLRMDNTRSNAMYLGYLDAKELYPDFKPISFEQFFIEALEGKAKRPYAGRNLDWLSSPDVQA